MMVRRELPHSWWFDSHNRSRQSPWLLSTLSELDEKTKQMLRLIEEDADSFGKRAEMYYKRRPQLVNMIEDFYRAHRSLVEQYDQLKSGGALRASSFGPSLSDRSWSQKLRKTTTDEASEFSLDSSDTEESEIDDPDLEEAEVQSSPSEGPREKESDSDLVKLKNEVERLKEENAALKAELAGKDEEKREVIRQLSFSLDILKDENANMRKSLKDSQKRSRIFELKKMTKEIFSGKLFGGHLKHQTTLVAL